MPKSKKRLDNQNPDQLTIFDILSQQRSLEPSPGSLDIDRQFRESVSAALKECPLSRYQVAARMSELTGFDITKSMLDSWTAESKEQHRFPAIFLPAFCEATGRTTPLEMLGQSAKLFVMEGPDALRADIRRDEEQIKKIRKRINRKTAVITMLEGIR
ncbi:MAG: hypothetical protein JW884_14115 [Deltaproteobacteria bacterium]|nr:hypothetical protein [Deltaproteobacteria bacterium]